MAAGQAQALDDTGSGPCSIELSGALPTDFVPWNSTRDQVESSSQIAALDSALGVILVHMSQFFGVQPEFGFIVEDEFPNAFASRGNPNGYPDGTVAFGRKLLEEQLAKPNGDFSVLAICAHEFGHIRQYRDGIIGRIESSTMPRYCVELHADFSAGAFVAYWKRRMRPEHLLEIGSTWSGLGSSDFNRPGSHGTTVQRVKAIEAGFYFRDGVHDASVEDIMQAGLDHVAQYG